MRLDTRLLLALNGLAARPNFPDRPDADSYATWEYAETEFQLELMRKAGVSLSVERILDIGCGLGGKTVFIQERCGRGEVIGLDISPRNVGAARQFARKRGAGKIRFLVGSASSAPIADASIDLIITT